LYSSSMRSHRMLVGRRWLRAQFSSGNLPQTIWTETIFIARGDPVHLGLRDTDLPTPALIPTARERHAASFARLGDRSSQNSTPGCALMPLRNGCLICFISVTRSASSINRSFAPRPVSTTCCIGGRARKTVTTSATST